MATSFNDAFQDQGIELKPTALLYGTLTANLFFLIATYIGIAAAPPTFLVSIHENISAIFSILSGDNISPRN